MEHISLGGYYYMSSIDQKTSFYPNVEPTVHTLTAITVSLVLSQGEISVFESRNRGRFARFDTVIRIPVRTCLCVQHAERITDMEN